jgi:hypothetical protein
LADVGTLSDVLRSPDGANFAVVQHEIGTDGEVSSTVFKQSVEQFFESGCRGELLFLYVASHAVVDRDGMLYILPTEFKPTLRRATAVPMSFLGSCLNDCKASYVTIVLDTCFADAGAWEIFSNRPTPFVVSKEQAPTFAVIATTRAQHAAADGAFAAVLSETVMEMDPLASEVAVPMSRIFDRAAARLRDTAVQFAKKWESGGGAIPFGREQSGPMLSREGIEELYASVKDAELVRGEADGAFDFVEVRHNRFGVEERIGIVLPPRTINAAEVKALGARITEAVGSLQVQAAIVLADRTEPLQALVSRRTSVLTFSEFRRRVQPIASYLEEHIEKYESSNLHKYGYYISVRATSEQREPSAVLDGHIDEWLSNAQDVNHLVVLGDFGTGKTTTAKRLFWRQSKRYLERPHVERVPIFVNLRNYNSIQQIEGLVQRTLNEFRLNAFLTVEDIFAMNEDGRVLWILDGFDEMAAKVTPIVARRNFAEIQRLLPPKSRMILTCRTHFFGGMEQVKDTFQFVGNDLYEQAKERRYRIMFVQAFSPDEIRQFVRARLRDPELSGGELTPDVILEKIADSQELTDLATRPILAEMIVFTLPDLIRKKLPLNLASLYREYTDNLLDRDAWRDVFADGGLRHEFPQQLAWHLYSSGRTELTFEEFPKYVKQFFANEVQSYNDVLELVVAAQTTPLFQRDDAGNYAFAHKSFLEFYTARYLEDALATGNSDLLEQCLLTPEVLRFLSQLIEVNSKAAAVMTALEERTRFSISYFFKRYFKVRFLPVLKRRNVQDAVQRKSFHRLVHLIGPFFIAAIAGTLATVTTDGKVKWFLPAFGAAYLTIIVASFLHYTYLTWRRRVMSPVWRYNVGGIVYVRERGIGQVPQTTMTQVAMSVREMDEERRPNAEHGWKALQGLSTPTQESVKMPISRRRSFLGPPPLLAVVIFVLTTIGVAGVAKMSGELEVAASWWLMTVGSLYGISLALRSVAAASPSRITRQLRRFGVAGVMLAVLAFAFFAKGWSDASYAPILGIDRNGHVFPRLITPRAVSSMVVTDTEITSPGIDDEVLKLALAVAKQLPVPEEAWHYRLMPPFSLEDLRFADAMFTEASLDSSLPYDVRGSAARLSTYFADASFASLRHLSIVSTPWSYLAFAHTAAVLAVTLFLHGLVVLLVRIGRKRAGGWWTTIGLFVLAAVVVGGVVGLTCGWQYWMMVTYVLLAGLSTFVVTAYVMASDLARRVLSIRWRSLFSRGVPVES